MPVYLVECAPDLTSGYAIEFQKRMEVKMSNLADRRDYETILATTADTVVLSRARRDSDGRLLGRSPLLAGLFVSHRTGYSRRKRRRQAR